ESFFANLEIPKPDVNLEARAETAIGQTAEIMRRLEPVLLERRPDWVVVVGDVNSTLAAAVTAVKLGIPLAHVEAGLRSGDRTMPEEINRILTDSISDLLFTTEPVAAENLAHEGVAPGRVHFVGNVMIDTLFRYRERARESSILRDLGLAPGGYAALTLHRPSNVDAPETLGRMMDAIARIQAEIPVVFPVHPRTRARIAKLAGRLEALPGLRLIEPQPYLDFVQLMASARCVLTDSGGIQEETTALRVPCLTLRENTERPITIEVGSSRLVGSQYDKIVEAFEAVLAGPAQIGAVPEIWDGKAAERIANNLVAG